MGPSAGRSDRFELTQPDWLTTARMTDSSGRLSNNWGGESPMGSIELRGRCTSRIVPEREAPRRSVA